MKVVLVRLPEDFSAGLFQVFTRYEALGLGYVTAVLRQAGHHVTIIDGTILERDGIAEKLTTQSRLAFANQYLTKQLSAEESAWLVVKTFLGQEILAAGADLIGFSLISSMTYGHVTEMSDYLRELGLTAPIVAGGEQAALYAEDVLTRIPGMDACITGEGEEVVLELVERLEDRSRWAEIAGLVWRNGEAIVRNPGRRLILDLDALPFPSRDHLPAILALGGETVLSGSRGCPAKCGFCSIVEFFDRGLGAAWRGRSPHSIVEELTFLYETYGADRFWIIDDEFFGGVTAANFERAEEIFQRLIEARLPIRFDIFCRANAAVHSAPRGTLDLAVKAGLRRALIGVESGSKETLKKVYTKGTTPEMNRQAIIEGETRGIDIQVEFIMFNPWTTLADLEDNLQLLTSVPRGTQGAIGKHDPMILGSRLYIHRETPLGRDFQEKWQSLMSADPGMGEDFFIPYNFQDARVAAVYEIVSPAFNCFTPVEGVIEQLYRLVDRFWLPEWSDRPDAAEIRALGAHYSAVLDYLKSLRSDEALDFFREALAFVKDYDLEGPETEAALADAVSGLAGRMTNEAANVAKFVYVCTVTAIQEVGEILTQRNLLGPRTLSPHPKGGD